MTKARWKACWGTCAATFWCRCRPSKALMRSMPTWNNDAWSEWTPSSGDIRRPSVRGWSGTWQASRVSSLSLVRYRTNDYSVPVAYGYRDVLVRGYVDAVVISCGTEVIASHPRSYERDDFVYDPIHYLPLLERKPGALDQAAPLQAWDLPEEFGTLRRLLESRMGRRGKREFVQVLRLLGTFSQQEVHAAVKDAIHLGSLSFDAVKHLVLCRLEGRPPRLDMELYPYLPRVRVSTTSARDYMTLLAGRAA